MVEPDECRSEGLALVPVPASYCRFRLADQPRAVLLWAVPSVGGAKRARTADLLIANQALYRLSYGPVATNTLVAAHLTASLNPLPEWFRRQTHPPTASATEHTICVLVGSTRVPA